MEEPEENQDEVTEYKAMVEEDAWSGFNQGKKTISNIADGA